jgi:uncharacterized protein
MKPLEFEWDDRKNLANQRKHGISFEEATSVFYDGRGLFMADPGHSGSEDRFVLLGLSADLKTLVVCHCYRGGDVIRIISARKATRREQLTYSQRWVK